MSESKSMKKVFNFIVKKLINVSSKTIPLHHILGVLSITRYRFKRIYQKKHSLNESLIVSLTSYPPRFHTLHLTLKTLLSQSIVPNLVLLWIHEDDLKHLPKSILDLQGDQFNIKTTDKKIRSFTKIIPSLETYPASYIATADDDSYYNYDWLEELINWHDPNKKEIIGHRGHRITFNENDEVAPYNNWKWCIGGTSHGLDIFLTGVGGILYPPNSLSKECQKSELFMKLCPTNDDIWLYFMAHLNGYIPKKIPSDFREFNWPSSQSVALNTENVTGELNDILIKNLVRQYGKLR
jgi:hypothetical protein